MPSNAEIKKILARQGAVTGMVWPNGIPSRDRVLLDSIPIRERGRVLDRLEAVWRAERGEPLGPLADLAGLKRVAFYNLRSAWRANSLAGLVPNQTRSGRRVAAGEDDPLRARASMYLNADPGRRNVDIAKTLLDENRSLVVDDGPNAALVVLQRLERLVQHERRALASDPDFLRGAYGLGMILDVTAVSIVLDEGERSLAIAAMLVDTASGLILGSALGNHDAVEQLQLDALADGLDFIARRKADLPPSRVTAPDLGLMIPATMDAEKVGELLRPHVRELFVGWVGGFSFGAQLVQNIGPRVGRMVLNPRRTLTVDVEQFLEKRIALVATLAEAKAIWALEVDRHNVNRIAALRKAEILDAQGLANGRLSTVIRAIAAALTRAHPPIRDERPASGR